MHSTPMCLAFVYALFEVFVCVYVLPLSLSVHECVRERERDVVKPIAYVKAH